MKLPASLGLAARRTGSTTELIVSGEWDLAGRGAAHAVIIDALEPRPGYVVLDLSRLSFMDSSGIHSVCELNDLCARETIELVIVPGRWTVQRLFEICGVADLLPFLTGVS